MKTSEDSLQVDVMKALAYLLTDSQCLYFHVPNGGARSAREGAKFKKMGVRAGWGCAVQIAVQNQGGHARAMYLLGCLTVQRSKVIRIIYIEPVG